MKKMKDILAQNLKSMRLFRDLSQTEAAQRIGINVQYVSMLERGVNWPSSAMLDRILEGYDAYPEELTARKEMLNISTPREKSIIESFRHAKISKDRFCLRLFDLIDSYLSEKKTDEKKRVLKRSK